MKEIPLTQGKVALVDDEDFEMLNQHKWYAKRDRGGRFYAARNAPRIGGKQSTIRMHKVILPVEENQQVDHFDGNGLNNQKRNLRRATPRQNSCNRRKRLLATSRFNGVHWNKEHRKWQAQVAVNGKRTTIGRFANEVEAAKAFDARAKELYGEFAMLNFPKMSNNAQEAGFTLPEKS